MANKKKSQYWHGVSIKKAKPGDIYETATTQKEKVMRDMLAQGWEIVSTEPKTWAHPAKYVLRRPLNA